MIDRILTKSIMERMWHGKAIIVFGARQVGKTTMVKEMLHGRDDVLWLNGDEPDVRNLFDGATSTLLKSIIGNKKIVVIDEAQRISDIGIYIKLIADNIPDIQVIATGSSSFDLSTSNPQPIGFSGILLAKRQNSFYCTYFLHNRNVADTKSPYPIKRLEVIRWFNQKSMVFNQSLS